MKKIQVSKILFFALAAVLPVNLGKHFEFSGSYVYGNLVDYLVPTLYLQDILALALLLAVIFEKKKIGLQGPVKKLGIFLGILFLSSLVASRTLPSMWFMFRIFLESQEILDNIDEESYLFEFEETAKIFEDFFDDFIAYHSLKILKRVL